jgi:hypothetical protein
MDERTRILICLGSATAANCIPCFEHYYGKAEVAKLTQRIRIDRESEANHDLILWLDEPGLWQEASYRQISFLNVRIWKSGFDVHFI